MASDSKMRLAPLREIRDRVLLLSLGNAYLCETPFLKKIGLVVDKKAEELRKEITTMKARFPGKFKAEVETDPLLDDLRKMAKWLQNPDDELNQKCTVGLLGQEMETMTGALTDAVEAIRVQVEGRPPSFTKTDLVLRFLGLLNPFRLLPPGLASMVARVLIVLIVLSAAAGGYLYVTMEKEETLQSAIQTAQASLSTQGEELARIENERDRLSAQIQEEMARGQSRKGKIDVLDLQLELQKLDDKRFRVMSQMDAYQRKVKEKEKKLEEIKKKAFLLRLLRL